MSEEFSEIFNKSLRFLNFRPRSEHEMRVYLDKKGASEETKSQVIEKLKNLKLIDDGSFVDWWVEQRTNVRPRSIRVIKLELREKGISRDLIDKVLESFSSNDEVNSAIKVAERKMRRLSGYSGFGLKQKLLQALSMRGFSYEVAKEAIEKLLKTE